MKILIDSIIINARMRDLSEDKATEIAASIKEIGLINPITISPKNELIAGLHRLKAFQMLGFKEIEANVVNLEGLKQELAEIDENLIRHELHYIDRGEHLKRRKEIYELLYPETKQTVGKELADKRWSKDASPEPVVAYPNFVDDTAIKTGRGASTIREDIQIAREITPEVKEVIKKIELPKNDAIRLARVEQQDQKRVIEKIEKKEAKDIRQALQQIKHEELKERVIELPKDKYNVIYADPPWDIGSFVLDKWESPLEDKYPTMSSDELKRMDIPNLCADDCVLFMWSTLTTIPQALELLNTWGFRYHILITWDKGNGWSSTGFHRRTEVILVGYKGKITNVITQSGKFIPTIITEQKREHSKKPEVMYNLLLSNTTGKRIELFAREKRDGFDVYGNEV